MDAITSKLFDLPDQEVEALWTQIHPKMQNTKECIQAIADYFDIKNITFQSQEVSAPNNYLIYSDDHISAENNTQTSEIGSTQMTKDLQDVIQNYKEYFDKMKDLQSKQEKILQSIPASPDTPKS